MSCENLTTIFNCAKGNSRFRTKAQAKRSLDRIIEQTMAFDGYVGTLHKTMKKQ